MSPAKTNWPSFDKIIEDRLRTAIGPMPVEYLVAQMLAAHPTQSKKPQQAMRNHLRQAAGRLLIFLDTDTVLPLRLAFQGARFRLPLDRQTVKKGLLDMTDSLPSYLPSRFPVERVRLLDAAGQPIVFQTEQVSQQVQTLFGRSNVDVLFANLGAWFHGQRATAQDNLVFTLLDWEQGVFQLELEQHQRQVPAQRAARNRLLADTFYEMLEKAVDESILVFEAVPTVYGRLPDKGGYPADHWMMVVATDERLTTDGVQIKYRDGQPSIFDLLMGDDPVEQRQAPAPPVSKEQAAQVYRFKAEFWNRPNLWRTIEIQGKQSLADLDGALRAAFQHDGDHLGGFWKLISRGAPAKDSGKKRSRVREVEAGDVEPGGGGSGARVKIASLGLAPGDQLKYVFDFGDWIEHRLTLETIATPQARVKYPREVARNEPHYLNCVECQKRGQQTRAITICLDCSNRRDKDVLLCEACAEKRHEDHYTEEIVY